LRAGIAASRGTARAAAHFLRIGGAAHGVRAIGGGLAVDTVGAQTMNATTTTHPSGDTRFKLLDAFVKKQQFRPDALIEVLHKSQELFGYLDTDVLVYVGRALRVPPSRVYGVATFYNFFTLKPAGRHTCVVCLGTACYVKGAGGLLAAIEHAQGVRAGETTGDGALSVVTARCLGACGLAPAVVFDGQVAGHVEPAAALARLQRWTNGDEQRSA
jgi:bidirectional [NiFe] hydrogenase diaphorase subunit